MDELSGAARRRRAPDETVGASFRDPAGALFPLQGRILRVVHSSGVEDLAAFQGSRAGLALVESGHVVSTRILDAAQSGKLLADPAVRALLEKVEGWLVVEHERIAFPSFPYEWPPEMLHSAAELTLQIAKHLLKDGLGLKDATPYNILFRGPEPVFIDVLSFERRDPMDPIWLPHAQFVRTFLLPLLANKYLDLPLDQVLISRRDGLEPEEVYRWSRPLQRIRPPFLTLASIPTWLATRHRAEGTGIYQRRSLPNPAKARYILDSLLTRSSSTLSRLTPATGRRSTWTEYMTSESHHSKAYFASKAVFVEQAITEFRPKRVLDVGCNTGHLSVIAAKHGARVVAIDRDSVVLSEVWQKARSQHLDILPLHVDFTRPSPGIGWRNRECPSFLDRARGHFDAVLMLAVLHHLLVAERIPLADVLAVAAELTTDLLVIEFIAPHDPMFRCIARGRDELHTGLSREVFENTCRNNFEILRFRACASSSRWLYLLRKS